MKNQKRHFFFFISEIIRYLYIGGMLLFFSEGIAQVTSSIDSTSVQIGEELQYSISVQADTTALVVFPEGQTFLPLEVIESYKIDTTFEEAVYRLKKMYGLIQFDSGVYTIPPQRILINEKAFLTDSLQVKVRDIAVDTTVQKMYDIKPAIEVGAPPFNYLKLLYWLLPLLVIGAITYFLFRRKKKREAAERELPPYEEAMVALQQLDNAPLLSENRSKEYYSSLTEIVKRYLDREVDDTALESTSDELIARLQLHKDAGHFEFDPGTIEKLDAIFKRADLVKFAKMSQQVEQARADRTAVEDIINETKEAIPEPSEEELLQNEVYRLEQLKKRRRKRIFLGAITAFVALFVAAGVLVSIYGLPYLKDRLIGHPTKELVEGRWIKSEYGLPAVVMETPKVLVRTESIETSIVKDSEAFSYGNVSDNFYIRVSTLLFNEGVVVEIDQALESELDSLEQKGAVNMLVKREDFSTEEGVEGVKAYGEFSFSDTNEQPQNEKKKYVILIFGQEGAMQEIIIIYNDMDPYAETVVDRIVNSVEVEISEN